jgi:hypothetical protein
MLTDPVQCGASGLAPRLSIEFFKRSNMTRSLVVAVELTALLAPAPLLAQAPEARPTPHRMHPRITAPSHKAHELETKLEAQIAAARSKGLDVSDAEMHEREGDEELRKEHFW